MYFNHIHPTLQPLTPPIGPIPPPSQLHVFLLVVVAINNLLSSISDAHLCMGVDHLLGHRQLLVNTPPREWLFLPPQPTAASGSFTNSETLPLPWNPDWRDLVHVLCR